MNAASLKDAATHFRFGENWAHFAKSITDSAIARARADLARLLGTSDLRGRRFLDIGSGSGIHSLAALQLGADHVTAIDIDADSVATTRGVLATFAHTDTWTAAAMSVFEATPERLGRFDIVYSWGVLHHTGAMYDALRAAAGLVAPGGELCIALYAKTSLCRFWGAEKWLYSRSPRIVQRMIARAFIGWTWLISTFAALRRGRRFSMAAHVKTYSARGMEFHTDVHDWLGGYPYESIAPAELRRFLGTLGLEEIRSFIAPGGRSGLLGSGCDEYVFRLSAG